MRQILRFLIPSVGAASLLLAGVPAFAATFVVTNTQDSGSGSLRQAFSDANSTAGPHSIVFAIPTGDAGFDGQVFRIRLASALPTLRGGIAVDATTQTAATGDTNPWGPEVVLDGSLVASDGGIAISGDGGVVRGFVIQGFDAGTGIGLVRLPFDPTPSGNLVEGNYVGTDATGTVAVPNNAGILIGGFGSPSVQAAGNVVRDNLVSGNRHDGISLCDAADTLIENNWIGTDRTGTRAIGNGRHGIVLVCAGAPRTTIRGNVIAFSGGDGVRDHPDYRFGVAFTANGHQGNRITGNSIHSNAGLGIDLLPPPFQSGNPPSAPNPNDSCDGDVGANRLQNFPLVTLAHTSGGGTLVEGILDSTPNASFTVELFASDAADPSGFGEGQSLLASVGVTTDATCLGSFSVQVPAVASGRLVSATATDSAGNTSELSPVTEVTGTLDRPPVARCTDVEVAADESCSARAVVDAGSFDPDGDPVVVTQDPPGPYPLGTTLVTLTVESGAGLTDSCQATVTVTDETPPVARCNAPATIVPPDAPIAFVSSAEDNCSVESVEIPAFDCFLINPSGKRVDKTDSCEVEVDGAILTVLDSGGVGDRIVWSVTASDIAGGTTTASCELEVVRPGSGGVAASTTAGKSESRASGRTQARTDTASPAASCVIPPVNLVSWWPGDGNADDIVAGNNGLLQNGATFSDGLIGQAFRFLGPDDIVRVPHAANLDVGFEDVTIDAWIKMDDPTFTNDRIIASKFSTSTPFPGYIFRFLAGKLQFIIDSELGGVAPTVQDKRVEFPIFRDRDWHHVAAIRRGLTMELYYDGALVSSVSHDSLEAADNEGDLGIGNNVGAPDNGFPGVIDELEIFDRALAAEEVAALYEAGNSGKCKIAVTIDVQPGSDNNSINPRSRGIIPVAILTDADFDATAVNPGTVRFGPDGAAESHGEGHIEDIDDDGDLDMLLHFRTRETGVQCGDVFAALTGGISTGTGVVGIDAVRTIGCK